MINIPSSELDCPHFINNEVAIGSGDKKNIFSPYSGEIIGSYHCAKSQEVDQAVHFAVEAQKEWGKKPLKERSRVMFKFRDQLLSHIESISHLVSSESGKTLSEAKAGILKGIEVLEFALSLQNLDSGGKMEVSRGVFCEYRRMPLGVVASITPFNFPAMVPMWTIPIAITLGNTYIWKPSEKTPLTSLVLADALKKAGLPSGIFQVLQGERETAELILKHQDIKAISFVGSTEVAKQVYRMGTDNNKRVLALGGAKNHIVLLPDANLDITGPGISDSFTGCAGQRCMAASVVLAVGNVERHIDKIVERAQSLVLGKDMGAIISKEQVDFLSQAIEEAVSQGAKLLLDGRKARPVDHNYKEGYWIGPTILDQVNPKSDAATKELFGPILSIVRCQNLDEAMNIENTSSYGNACSVFTSSGPHSEAVLSRAKAGMLGVNIGVPVPREPFSFGGIGDSKFGHGEITGEGSLNFWSDLQKVTTKWEVSEDHNWMS